ncbi:MAG: hypothetical protein HY814_05540 [Candidatus Riflebacteria bacterium]|nr:hypothetical protein [Candidatus Riflebacteria bacterium]
MPTPTNVLQILTDAGLLDEPAIDRIRAYASEHQVDLAHVVLALGLATEDELAAATAQVFRPPFVRQDEVQVEPDALLRIPRNQMLKYGILPVSVRNNVLTVVTCNPVHVLQIEAGLAGRGLRLKSLVVSQTTLNHLFEKYIRHLPYASVQEATRSAFLSGFQGG